MKKPENWSRQLLEFSFFPALTLQLANATGVWETDGGWTIRPSATGVWETDGALDHPLLTH